MFLEFHKTFISKGTKSQNKVSLSLNRGEHLSIQGPSGSGKSSYINALLGFPNILKGEIYFKKNNLKEIDSTAWTLIRRHDFSVVLQSLGLFKDLTVKENIELILNLYPENNFEEISYIKKTLGISEYEFKTVATLSLGEKQRLAICRALIRPYSILILDEPFSHLDKKNISKCIGLITESINKNKASLLLTSHHTESRFNFNKNIDL